MASCGTSSGNMGSVWKAYSAHWFESRGNPTVFHTDHVFVLFTITKKGQFKACEEEHMTAVRWPKFCFGPNVWHCVRTEAGLAAGRSMLIYIHCAKNNAAKQYVLDLSLERGARLQHNGTAPILSFVFSHNILYPFRPCGGSHNFPTQGEAVRPVATCLWMQLPNIQTSATLVFPQEW